MMNDIEKLEHELWLFWDKLPEPKPQYVTWFYTSRKAIVKWLFSTDVELPEKEE